MAEPICPDFGRDNPSAVPWRPPGGDGSKLLRDPAVAEPMSAEERIAQFCATAEIPYAKVNATDAFFLMTAHAAAAVEAVQERLDIHMHRMLALARDAIAGKHVSREFGGNAPEDVQGLLDEAFVLHSRAERAERERDEARGFYDLAIAQRNEERAAVERKAAEIATVTRERDEARAEVKTLRDSMMKAHVDKLKGLLQSARVGLTFVPEEAVSNPLPPWGDEGFVNWQRLLDSIDKAIAPCTVTKKTEQSNET